MRKADDSLFDPCDRGALGGLDTGFGIPGDAPQQLDGRVSQQSRRKQ
jgi:hypothetical protein